MDINPEEISRPASLRSEPGPEADVDTDLDGPWAAAFAEG